MEAKFIIKIHITEKTIRDVKKKLPNISFYVIDILKIIKDLEYDIDNLSPASEFILNNTIHNKIYHGINSKKYTNILISYKDMKETFEDNLRSFLDEIDDLNIYIIEFI